jgi:hypothetical protein
VIDERCGIRSISVNASRRATFWAGDGKWATQRCENFSVPGLFEAFSASSARSAGSATQVLRHWQKDIYVEMPQVAAQGQKRLPGVWSILPRSAAASKLLGPALVNIQYIIDRVL